MNKKSLRHQINDLVDSDVQRVKEHGPGYYSYVREDALLLAELEDVCEALGLVPNARTEATREGCWRAIRERLGTDGGGDLTAHELAKLREVLTERGCEP